VSGSEDEKEAAQRRFVRASRAYEVLSNKELREVYDAMGEAGLDTFQSGAAARAEPKSAGGAARPDPAGYGQQGGYGYTGSYDGGTRYGGTGGFAGGYGGFAYSDPRDLFSRLFGQARPQVMYVNGEPVLVGGGAGAFGDAFGGGFGSGYPGGYGVGYAGGSSAGYGAYAGGNPDRAAGSRSGYGGAAGQQSTRAGGSSAESCAFPQTPLRPRTRKTSASANARDQAGRTSGGRGGRSGNIFSSYSALEHLKWDTIARFRADVRAGTGADLSWLVLLYSPRCPHTEAMVPLIEQLAEELQGFVRVAAVDAEEHAELASELGVNLSPTILRFRPGSASPSTPRRASPAPPSSSGKSSPSSADLRAYATEFRLVPTLRSLAEFALEGLQAAAAAQRVDTPEQLSTFLASCAPARCGCIVLVTNRSETPLLYRALTRALDAGGGKETSARFRYAHAIGVASARSPMAQLAGTPRIPALIARRSAAGPAIVYDGPLELPAVIEFMEGRCGASERAAEHGRGKKAKRLLWRARETWTKFRKWLSQTF